MPTSLTAACSVSTSRSRSERGQLLRFFLNVARGRWRDNPHVEIHEGERVVLKLLSRQGKRRCVIDGELLPLAAKQSCKFTRRR